MGKSLTKWLPLYRVETVLTHSNYIIRKVGTNYMQCVQRIRLRPIQPQYQVEDLTNINSSNFQLDPSTRHVSEPSLFDNALPNLLQDKTFTPEDEIPGTPAVVFCYQPRRLPPVASVPPAPPPPPVVPQALPVAQPLSLHTLPPPQTFDFPRLETNRHRAPSPHQVSLTQDVRNTPVSDRRHESFILSSRDSTPPREYFSLPHSSFFPSTDTTFDSFDVFTVADTTLHLAHTTSFFTYSSPVMHSTPIKTAVLVQPQELVTPIPPEPPTSSHKSPLTTTATRPKIYDQADLLDSSSRFSGFSEALVNRARTVLSPSPPPSTPPTRPHPPQALENSHMETMLNYPDIIVHRIHCPPMVNLHHLKLHATLCPVSTNLL